MVIQPLVIIYTLNNHYSKDIAYIGDSSLWENFWQILGMDGIQVDVHFTAPIRIKNKTRKDLSSQAYQQMEQVLRETNYPD